MQKLHQEQLVCFRLLKVSAWIDAASSEHRPPFLFSCRPLPVTVLCMRYAVSCLTSLLVAALAPGEERFAPPYRLQDVAGMEAFVGSADARELLARQGFVVTGLQFPQIFAAYLRLAIDLPQEQTDIPWFITEDSVWHAYHVLLEEGVHVLEEVQADRLHEFSTRLLRAAQARSATLDAVDEDLAAFAAVGLGLQDPAAVEAMGAGIQGRVAEVLRGLRASQPARVLFFELAIPPDSLRATGIYTRTPASHAYFAARRWYATCVFRWKSLSETERAVRLACLIDGDQDLKTRYRQLDEPYDLLFGPPDDAGVDRYATLTRNTFGVETLPSLTSDKWDTFRQQGDRLPAPKVNDQLLSPNQYARFAEETKGFRLFPPRRCPSAVVLQRMIHPLVKQRQIPSGVDFFAVGALASEAGRRAVLAQVPDRPTSEAILGTQAEPLPQSLHGDALSLLRRLHEPRPDAAPGALRTAAWQDKQLWTSLGAWAEQRHTWALHAKRTESYFGSVPPAARGYVSPYPEFYRDLGRLARSTAAALQAATAKESESVKLLPEFAELCDRLARIAEKQLAKQPLGEADYAVIENYGQRLARFHFYEGNSWLMPRDDFPLVTPVFSSPAGNRNEILYAGLGRPEALYVIIPVGDQLVLHRGAVLSYREFTRATGPPLDDMSWAKEVTHVVPPAPAFTGSFRRTLTVDEAAEVIGRGDTLEGVGLMRGREITRALIEASRQYWKGDDVSSERDRRQTWRIRQLGQRAGNEDLPDLMSLLKLAPEFDADSLASSVAGLDWASQGRELTRVLIEGPQHLIDPVAYLLARYPNGLDSPPLAVHYDRLDPRARRLVCWLVGFRKNVGEAEQAVLLKGLSDGEAGVRYEAAAACARGRARDHRVLARLEAWPKEKNTFVAASMVRALSDLKAIEAAPAMLRYLEAAGEPGSNASGPPLQDEDGTAYRQAFPFWTGPYGNGRMPGVPADSEEPSFRPGIQVEEMIQTFLLHAEKRPSRPGEDLTDSLPETLVLALGTLRHAPAKPLLRGLLRKDCRLCLGDGVDTAAVDALVLQADRKARLLVQVAGDGSATPGARARAIDLLARTGDSTIAARLAPLLSDSTPLEYPPGLRLGDCAGNAMARMVRLDVQIEPDDTAIERAGKLEQIRKAISGRN